MHFTLNTKLLFLLILKNVPVRSILKYDLNEIWNLRDASEEYINLSANVPGGIYTDLANNNIIGDIFYGFNDTETRWVAKKEWIYEKVFVGSSDLLNHKGIDLVFEGLDTFATIYLNNEEIGQTENMFLQYTYDVKSKLKLGNNNLTIKFDSPIEQADRIFEKQMKSYLVPPLCVPDEYNGECHVNHIRKMQASFSWDWGPAFPSVGIWKEVFLNAYNSSTVKYVTVNITSNATTDSWDVQLKTYFAPNDAINRITGKLVTELLTDITLVSNIYDINLESGNNTECLTISKFSVPKLSVGLWWPNGYGNAKLYTLKVMFYSDYKEESSKTIKIGFRTVELVQNHLDEGLSFYFKVNNIPIFAKGSNTIPISILPEKGSNETTVRFLLQSAKDVHMNMLRVWGGGVYESDLFYEVADEMGILIWQDFMFACSMYPTNEEFLSTVADEVRHQVLRLQHHASIALWAGNNENEAALRGNWYGTASNFSLYADDYVKLYADTIRNVVLECDESRMFLTSSPTNGKESDEEGFIAENPYSNFYGDVHFYNYIKNSWDPNIYPITRFASEYGYQSLPEISTLLTATQNIVDLHPDSEFLVHRQHHPAGYEEMKSLIGAVLNMPDESRENYYKAFIFYSQIVQAMAVKIESEFYRQWRSNLNEIGEGLTMGALYWQLNDIWVAPTWSGIDFKNKWKMLHYFAKDFFAPVIVTGHITSARDLNVYVVSDLTTSTYNASVSLKVYTWNSTQQISSQEISTDMLAGVSKLVFSTWIDKYLSQYSECGALTQAPQKCFIVLTVEDSNGKQLTPDNYVFPAALRLATLPDANITVLDVKETDIKNQFVLTISADAITLFVWLDSPYIPGRFSENGFLQIANLKQVYFYSDITADADELKNTITITHLRDPQFL